MVLTKEEVLDRLRKVKPELERFGVSKVGLFGSYVRGEATEDSDIDVLIDFVDLKHSTLINLIDTEEVLEKRLNGKKVDLVLENCLSKFIGPYILREVQYV